MDTENRDNDKNVRDDQTATDDARRAARRRFLAGGLAAAPVVLTLTSRSALAGGNPIAHISCTILHSLAGTPLTSLHEGFVNEIHTANMMGKLDEDDTNQREDQCGVPTGTFYNLLNL